MLKIFYGRDYKEYNGMKVIVRTSDYFDFVRRRNWLDDQLVKEMILDVDKSKVLGNGAIDSPILGIIPPEKLSTGVKALILMRCTEGIIINGSSCGDNCLPWMLKIASDKDVIVNFRHFITFKEEPFEIEILETGIVARNNEELLRGLSLSDDIWQEYHKKIFGEDVFEEVIRTEGD